MFLNIILRKYKIYVILELEFNILGPNLLKIENDDRLILIITTLIHYNFKNFKNHI